MTQVTYRDAVRFPSADSDAPRLDIDGKAAEIKGDPSLVIVEVSPDALVERTPGELVRIAQSVRRANHRIIYAFAPFVLHREP
jgi:hypothetical protein